MTCPAISASAQVDLHSHAIPQTYISSIRTHGIEMDEGFPIPSWSAEAHLQFMDEAGIQTSVLTMPAPQPVGEDAPAVCRAFNEECALLKARYPGRFLFCAALPLPDVDAAIAEAEYALDVLGADGVKLASNAYGQYLGDEALEPLMAFLNERKAVLITHPHRPLAVNEALVSAVPLASYEYLAETTRAILNMVAHNVLVRYPDLKVVVPHCGSFLPNALPRFKGLLPVMVAQGYMEPVDVDANLSRLYFDLAGAATDEVVGSLLTITEPTHLLYGSDYPYVAPQALIVAKKSLEHRLSSHGLAPEDILSNNAARPFEMAGQAGHDGTTLPGLTNCDRAVIPDLTGCTTTVIPGLTGNLPERIVRLAEIEVFPEKLEEYLSFAKEVGKVSMATEPGVLTLFSMQSQEDPAKIYILEIYADRAAYQRHIQTAHFKKYKEGTSEMVKSLKLTDVQPLLPEAAPVML